MLLYLISLDGTDLHIKNEHIIGYGVKDKECFILLTSGHNIPVKTAEEELRGMVRLC